MATEITSRTISVILNRLKGIPRSAGSWQARAFIWAISSSGKKEWSASSGFIHKPLLSFIEKALAPLTNCLSRQIESFTDFLVLPTRCGKENYLGPDYISIRCRIFSSQATQIIPFFVSQNNLKWTFSRHDSPSLKGYHAPISAKSQQTIRNIIYEENHLAAW